MATFHPFPRLPRELRIQIWALAFDPNRVLKIYHRGDRLPSTPVPGVTQATRESRTYCSYQKAFPFSVSGGGESYIWTKFDSDIIQMRGVTMSTVAENEKFEVERKEIRRLRIDVFDDEKGYETEFFHHNHSLNFCHFPKLEGVDVLVSDELRNWAMSIEDLPWGACPKSNVRIIDAKTGEWIDMQTAGPYSDWIDTGGSSEEGLYQRIDYDWDGNDEEDVKERYEAMMKMREGLPRIDLNY